MPFYFRNPSACARNCYFCNRRKQQLQDLMRLVTSNDPAAIASHAQIVKKQKKTITKRDGQKQIWTMSQHIWHPIQISILHPQLEGLNITAVRQMQNSTQAHQILNNPTVDFRCGGILRSRSAPGGIDVSGYRVFPYFSLVLCNLFSTGTNLDRMHRSYGLWCGPFILCHVHE